jgi:hypothetical protein
MTRPATLVWIDAREAIVVRWKNGPRVTRHELDTPPHEKSVGHVRHDPGVRHGGGLAQSKLETDRLEHLRQGIRQVTATLPADEDIVIIGPGTMRERLAAEMHEADRKRPPGMPAREVRTEAAHRLTEAQLVERLRELVGEPPPRIRPTGGAAPGDH